MRGYDFSWEKFNGETLKFKLNSRYVIYDTLAHNWKIINYTIRRFDHGKQHFEHGDTLIKHFNVIPSDYSDQLVNMDVMNYFQLDRFITKERIKGSENIKFYLVEKYRRIAFPFATLILTLIGASLSSQKIRGGMGLHLAFGIVLSFTYIIFMQISTVFATYGTLSPFVAVWIPNIIFSIIALYLLKRAPK